MKDGLSRIWNFEPEEVTKLVGESESLRDLAKKLGYQVSGSGYTEPIKRYCKIHNIDLLPVIQRGKLTTTRYQGHGRKYSNDEIFIKNSPVSRGLARKRVISDNLIEYKCSVCGQEPFWNGKPLTLNLDHINGDPTDNRLDNLRFICLHCDSQQDTYCGKNIKTVVHAKKKYYCQKCGKEVKRGRTLCNDCSKVRKIPKLSKDDLLKLLIEYDGNKTLIGRKLGITDNAVRKRLRTAGLPYKYQDIKSLLEEIKASGL